jgi:hypothetical protein
VSCLPCRGGANVAEAATAADVRSSLVFHPSKPALLLLPLAQANETSPEGSGE